MKWSNLKLNKCPQCNKSLVTAYDPARKMFICSCEFKISEQKMKEIVSSKVQQDIDRSFLEVDRSKWE